MAKLIAKHQGGQHPLKTSPGTENRPANLVLDNILEYEKQAIEIRFPIDNTYELLLKKVSRFSNDIAMRQLWVGEKNESPSQMTFEQFSQKLNQTANLLHDLGVTRLDAVTILLPSLMENQIVLWGSQAVGIANPVNYFLETGHIVEIMNEVKTRVLVTLSPGDSIGLASKVAAIIQQVPSLEHILLVKDSEDGKIDTQTFSALAMNTLDFNLALEGQPGDRLKYGKKPNGSDVAIYFHTGGTTGKPKIAMLAHSSIAFVAQVYADYNHHHGRSAALNPLPLFHVFGTIAASLAIFIQGRCVIMMTPSGFRNPNVVKNWWHFIETYQVKWFATVPTILSALQNAPLSDTNIDCLKFINSGSAPLSVELKKSSALKFNAQVVSGYGMTESSCLIARCIYGYETPEDTVGVRIPYTQVITAIVSDHKIQKICDPGAAGVVLAKGPNIFKGYLDPVENAKAWVEGVWLNTGDIGVLDENGYLRLTGRAKDLIIRGGHNIDPQLIEIPLEKHQVISQAVAIGQPDAYAGEIPVAYVCLKDNSAITEEELLVYCQKHVSEKSAIPKRIEKVDAMPLTAVGKISKPELRNRATEYAVSHALKNVGIDADLWAESTPQKGQVIHITLSNSANQKVIKQQLKGFPIVIEFDDFDGKIE